MKKDQDWLLKEKWYGEKTAGFLDDCRRLEAGEPLAYVIGFIPFLDTVIYLDSHPLIPRPETEFWVSEFLDKLNEKTSSKSISILDLCAGSGCLGVAVGKSLDNSKIDFVELDQAHIETIKKNCAANGINEDRFKIYTSDLFAALPPDLKYNYILCNPPYIDNSLNTTDESVLLHEPHLALFGGHKGLELIEKIIEEAPSFLHELGELWIEHEPEQVEAIHNLGQKSFTTSTHHDQYGLSRFSRLVLQ